jgi:hypothetical protein
MRIRTFWTFFLKILGLYIVLGSIEVIAQFFSTTYYLFVDNSSDIISKSAVFGIIALIIFMYVLVLRFFVFKPNWIIDKLKLDKGFEEEKIELNTNSSTILRIAIIVIGGLMIVDTLPALCKSIFIFFQQESLFRNYPKTGWIIFDAVKTVIGYLLLTNSKFIADTIENQKTEVNN